MNEIQDKLNGLAKLGMNDTYIMEPIQVKRSRPRSVSKRKTNRTPEKDLTEIKEIQLRLFN